ncbi:unnamed protein product [Schistosoma curassoni]|uniref:Transposase n=1 Tax=Schistosoma curassoni TaxID=6186 RepID=A0A183KGY0_9TREM|nr:unnamed protein product [Schistosoma curassoni]
MAIRQIKSGKMLHVLFKKIWKEEQVPTDLKEGYLIEIPTKSNLGKCKNYRGSTLLSVPGKVFSSVVEPNERFSCPPCSGIRKDRL